jgi:hypothetical protein
VFVCVRGHTDSIDLLDDSFHKSCNGHIRCPLFEALIDLNNNNMIVKTHLLTEVERKSTNKDNHVLHMDLFVSHFEK